MIELKIAEIVFCMTCDVACQSILPSNTYQTFLSSARPDVRIRFMFKDKVDFKPRTEDKLISQGSSSLFRSEEGVVLVSGSPTEPQMVVFFRNNFCDVEAFFSYLSDDVDPCEVASSLPEYPPLRIVSNCLIARRGGLLVHGCGIVDEGRGYLFTGHSDHGKSTMARLWGGKAVVLGDEIMALAQDSHGGFRIYGTPWPGDYAKVSYGGAPLNRIFFLSHSRKNAARPVGGASAGAMLLERSFVPTWERTGMESTLESVDRLLQQIPCYDLGFYPDEDVVDFVRGLE